LHFKQDAVVVATGSIPLIPPIKGIDNPKIIDAVQSDYAVGKII